MQVAAGFAESLGELADQTDDGIADILGVGFQLPAVEHDGWRQPRNRLRRLARDDVSFALRHRERHFGLHIGPELGVVGKHRAHGRRREHVPIKDAVEHGAGHEGHFIPC